MRESDRRRDQLLVEECLKGSEEAWNRFYCQYIGLVRSIVGKKLIVSPEDREDVVQEVFAKLIKSLPEYNPQYSVTGFVCMIAERACISELRHRSSQKRDAITDPVDHHNNPGEDEVSLREEQESSEDLLEQHQLVTLIRDAMHTLDERCRELLRLKFYEEMSFKEIEPILGSNVNTLAVRAKRCMDQLKSTARRLMKKGVRT